VHSKNYITSKAKAIYNVERTVVLKFQMANEKFEVCFLYHESCMAHESVLIARIDSRIDAAIDLA
jgi:hypothetical protein